MTPERKENLKRIYSSGLDSVLKNTMPEKDFVDLILEHIESESDKYDKSEEQNRNLRERLNYFEKELAKVFKAYVDKYGEKILRE
jgi:hypothetical protein